MHVDVPQDCPDLAAWEGHLSLQRWPSKPCGRLSATPTGLGALHSDRCTPCRYVLWEAEDQGLLLPYACRMGCCTACAVRVREGRMHQPQALGVSQELRDRGFALMCVGYPETDLVLETGEQAALMRRTTCVPCVALPCVALRCVASCKARPTVTRCIVLAWLCSACMCCQVAASTSGCMLYDRVLCFMPRGPWWFCSARGRIV